VGLQGAACSPAQPEYYDPDLIASWSYDPGQRMMVSYDTPERRPAIRLHQADGPGRAHVVGIGSSEQTQGDQNLVWTVANALGAAITPGRSVEAICWTTRNQNMIIWRNTISR